jgi:hypothetical protein
MTAIEFAQLIRHARRGAHGWWSGRCPAHDDESNGSLSFRDGDYTLIPNCHAGCTVDAIARAVGKTVDDFRHPRPGWRRPRAEPRAIAAAYDYESETGAVLYQAVRLEPKAFYQRMPHPTTDGAWLNGLGAGWYADAGHGASKRVGEDRTTPIPGAIWSDGVSRRVLYRLPDLLALKPKVLFIVEGEKDADRLWALGLPATTSVAGAGKWKPHAAEYAAQVRAIGPECVVLIPDYDDPGRRHMRDVGVSLHAVGIAVRWLDLPDVPAHEDVSWWLDHGGDPAQFVALADQAPSAPAAEPTPAPTASGEPEASGPVDAEDDLRPTLPADPGDLTPIGE